MDIYAPARAGSLNSETKFVLDRFKIELKGIAEYYIGNLGRKDLSTNPIDLNILVSTLNGKVIANPNTIESLTGRVFIAAMQKATLVKKIAVSQVKCHIPQTLSRKKDFIPKIGYFCTTS